MLTQTITYPGITGSAAPQGGGGKGAEKASTDAFSIIFANAESSVTDIAGDGGGSVPAPSETKTVSTEDHLEDAEAPAPPGDEEDEAARAAAVSAVIPPTILSVRYDDAPAAEASDAAEIPVVQAATAPPEQAAADILAQQPEQETPVITILEGDTDIGASTQGSETTAAELSAPAQAAADIAVEVPEEELTARMPQTTGQQNAAEEPDPAQSAVEPGDGGLCPLENTNDTNDTSGASPQESGEERPGLERRTKDASAGADIRAENAFPAQQAVDISPERISADGQLDSMSADRAATTENLFETMVESIETSTANESSQMVIQLKPDHLGKVAIQLALNNAGLEIQIKADDLNVKGLIASQITDLTQALSEKGIRITGVDVVYTDGSDQFPDANQSQSQANDSRGERYTPYTYSGDSGEPISIYSAFTAYAEDGESTVMLDLGISSVEYRA